MSKSLSIALPMVVSGIISLEVLLLWLKNKDVARGWLLVWALVTTILYTCHFVFFNREMSLIVFSDTLYVAANLAVFPLYLVYISQMADMKPMSKKPLVMTLIFGLPLLAAACVGVLYALMSKEQTDSFISDYLYHGCKEGWTGLSAVMFWVHECCHAIFALQVLLVAVFGVRKINLYDSKVNQLYADTENKSLNCINVILYLLIFTSLLSIGVNALGRYRFDSSIWLAVPSFCFSALIFSIGWVGMARRFTIRDMEDTTVNVEDNILSDVAAGDSIVNEVGLPYYDKDKDNEKSTKEQNTDEQVTAMPLGDRFEILMKEEKLFLMHDLRLDDVAIKLATNRTYLLKAINDKYGTTFKEYVNRLRIDYAKQLMANRPEMTKAEVAYASGYNTMSSFYRNLNQYG